MADKLRRISHVDFQPIENAINWSETEQQPNKDEPEPPNNTIPPSTITLSNDHLTKNER